MSDDTRIDVTKIVPRGFDSVETVPKSSYKDCSTCVIVPTRTKFLHKDWVAMRDGLHPMMNQPRYWFFVTGAEVGRAYDDMVTNILAHPVLGKCEYVATIEDDVLVPPDGLTKLYESIDVGPFDGVSGCYFVKNGPVMAYGDPALFARTGQLDFKPIDVTPAMRAGGLVEVNGIAMGISLYRMSSLRAVAPPRFETAPNATQDLAYCRKARIQGQRFAVDLRVRCGHVDWASGVVY